MSQKLAVLLVNNNDAEGTLVLLNDLLPLQKLIEVFLLDNGCSSDQKIKSYLYNIDLSILYEESEEKLTMPVSFNLLGRKALLSEADFILIINKMKRLDIKNIKKYFKIMQRQQRWGILNKGMNLIFIKTRLWDEIGGFYENLYEGEWIVKWLTKRINQSGFNNADIEIDMGEVMNEKRTGMNIYFEIRNSMFYSRNFEQIWMWPVRFLQQLIYWGVYCRFRWDFYFRGLKDGLWILIKGVK